MADTIESLKQKIADITNAQVLTIPMKKELAGLKEKLKKLEEKEARNKQILDASDKGYADNKAKATSGVNNTTPPKSASKVVSPAERSAALKQSESDYAAAAGSTNAGVTAARATTPVVPKTTAVPKATAKPQATVQPDKTYRPVNTITAELTLVINQLLNATIGHRAHFATVRGKDVDLTAEAYIANLNVYADMHAKQSINDDASLSAWDFILPGRNVMGRASASIPGQAPPVKGVNNPLTAEVQKLGNEYIGSIANDAVKAESTKRSEAVATSQKAVTTAANPVTNYTGKTKEELNALLEKRIDEIDAFENQMRIAYKDKFSGDTLEAMVQKLVDNKFGDDTRAIMAAYPKR
jgi:hypothetical protein